MTPLQTFTAYRDAVECAGLLLQCQTNTQAKAFYCRTLAAYTAAKGMDALRRETT